MTTENRLNKLVDLQSQDLQCCAICQFGKLSETSSNDTFWICSKLSEFLKSDHIVEGSDVCRLFLSWDDDELSTEE